MAIKIIEAMKKIKELQIKADDLVKKVKDNCADLSIETPLYPNTAKQISEWMQAHSDVLKEILSLRMRIQATNLNTEVAVELGGKKVTKTITEWIHRRRDLAANELKMWSALSDRGLKEGTMKPTVEGGTAVEVKIRRYYDPLERDKKVELYRSEPSVIDRTLEVTNATVDLWEE